MSGTPDALERLAGLLVDLYTRPGYPFERVDPESYRLLFVELLKRGQFSLCLEHGEFAGWQSFYRVDEYGLAMLKDRGLEALLRSRPVVPIDRGPICYIAATVVAPGAPRGTYRHLYRLTRLLNYDAKLFAAHLHGRRRKARWWTSAGDTGGTS